MINKLDWDSEFFGFPVGMVRLDTVPDWDRFEDEFKSQAYAYRLIYLVTADDLLIPDNILAKYGGKFLNRRILYQKVVMDKDQDIPTYIREYNGKEMNGDFETLALISGAFSRFRIDGNFSRGQYEALYHTWIRRSLQRELADRIFVSEHDDGLTGMVTCKYAVDSMNIGLVAVSEAEQGKGTGRFLIGKLESQAFTDNLTYLRVPTQSNNVSACIFYEKLGFSPIDITNYYHLWIP